MDIEKKLFEKNVMKNMAAQEVFLFLEQNIEETAKSFSPTNNGDVYAMYTLLYTTLEAYTIDEIRSFRTNISMLDAYKKNYPKYITESI